MKRRILSSEELEQVKTLRQSGESWFGVQNKTSIPRHIAKREYEDCEFLYHHSGTQ